MSDGTRDLLLRGRAAAKAAEVQEARFFLEWVLRLDPPLSERSEALFWLSEIADPPSAVLLLQDLLNQDPTDMRARKKLALLQGKLNAHEIIDPNQFQPQPITDPQRPQADRFTCPQCGGRMTYSPDGQSLTCEYCEIHAPTRAPSAPAVEHDFVTTLATARGFSQPTATQVLDCQGCGASFLLTPQQLSMVCPYCGSNYVVQNTQSREIIPPTAVIPIQISENKARKALILWFKQQKFDTLPQVLPARCVYLPVWAFNFGGFVQCRLNVNLMDNEVTTVEDRPVSRQNVLVTATRSLPAVHHPALEGTCLDTIQPFHTKYLSHWPAETYQIPIADASLQARAAALKKEKEELRSVQGQPIGQFTVTSSRMFIESFMLILIPVWLTRYRFAQQEYSVMIHGQSGQVNAEKPAQGISGWLNQLFSASKD